MIEMETEMEMNVEDDGDGGAESHQRLSSGIDAGENRMAGDAVGIHDKAERETKWDWNTLEVWRKRETKRKRKKTQGQPFEYEAVSGVADRSVADGSKKRGGIQTIDVSHHENGRDDHEAEEK